MHILFHYKNSKQIIIYFSEYIQVNVKKDLNVDCVGTVFVFFFLLYLAAHMLLYLTSKRPMIMNCLYSGLNWYVSCVCMSFQPHLTELEHCNFAIEVYICGEIASAVENRSFFFFVAVKMSFYGLILSQYGNVLPGQATT